MGWVKTRTDAVGTTTTDYDLRGRVKKVTYANGTHVDYEYDKSGLRIGVRDPFERRTIYGYDDAGRLASVLDPMRGETKYEYDALSHMTAITDAKNHRTQFDYDAQGRLWRTTYPGGRYETLTYDDAGRLWTKTDRKSLTTTFHYDGGGRLWHKYYSGTTPTVTYGYDEADRMLSVSNGTDTLGMTYDLGGRLLSETSTLNSSSLGYVYDKTDRRLSVSRDSIEHAGYHYDPAGRLDKILRGSNEFGFHYDAADRRYQMDYPNGLDTRYNYEENTSRLTAVGAGRNNVATTEFHYGYDDAGNRVSKTALGYAEDYRYDDRDRLMSAVRTGAGAGQQRFGYDAVGNRETASRDGAGTIALYNLRNELTARDAGGSVLFRGGINEPGTVTVAGKPAALHAGNVFEAEVPLTEGTNTVRVQARDASGNTATQDYQVDVAQQHEGYTYDLNGNMETKTEGADTWRYHWNAENQLVRVEKNGVEAARFQYDPLGRRVRKTSDWVTTSYTYDGQDIIREARGGGPAYTYIHGPGIDEPLARIDGSGATYYHADGLGSIVAMTDDTGAVVSTRRYDAWGNLEVGAAEPGYAFTGREWDPETGLYYYRARYYDPKGGRFISEDPTQAGDYAYAADSPAIFTDPTGLYIVLAGEGWPKLLRLMQGLLGPGGRGLLGTIALGEDRQVVGCLGAMSDAGGFGPLLATMIASDKKLEIEMAPSMSTEYRYIGKFPWEASTTPDAKGGAFVIGAEESLKGYTQLIMGPEADGKAEGVNQGLGGRSMSSDGGTLAYDMVTVLAHELGHAYGNMLGLPVRRSKGTDIFALLFENLQRSRSGSPNSRILHDPKLW